MTIPSLDRLPIELLRQICRKLPCQSALNFILTCRSIHHACKDWTVWRAVVTQALPNATHLDLPTTASWKSYAIAAAKATATTPNRPWTIKDLGTWLPQMSALQNPAVARCDFTFLAALWGITAGGIPHAQYVENDVRHLSGVVRGYDAETCFAAQAASFALAVRFLEREGLIERPRDWLWSVPWLPTDDGEDQAKCVAIQHALANRTVGFFAASLRATRAANQPEPPSPTSIPFATLMNLPIPFSPDALEHFSTCHLPTMADPAYLTPGTWTGGISSGGDYGAPFNCIGGTHHDGYGCATTGASEPAGDFPHGRDFEGVVRFALVSEGDGDVFELVSNNFHTEAELHRLRLAVNRRTGRIIVHHWHRMRAAFMTTEGVVTPFGIVTRLLTGVWMWLWKEEWGAGLK